MNGSESRIANAAGAKVIALVPAHNEAAGIRETLASLLAQTHPVHVMVIDDNSTDQTGKIAREVAMSCRGSIEVISTVGNRFKKSGALNAAYKRLGERLWDYQFVLAMDADTVLADDLVERALEEFDLNAKLGAVCSRAGVVKQATHGFWEKMVYHWQHVEYAEFDRSRVGQHQRIKVAHGMCSVYAVPAIRGVMEMRRAGGKAACEVYDVHNITEDYELTVCIKKLGFAVAAGFAMYAWTDVPLRLCDLWNQRVRWLRGGLDTLWQHGWHPATRVDILNAGFFWIMLMLQLILLNWTVIDFVQGEFHLNGMLLGVLALMYLDSVYTLRYAQELSAWDYLIRLTFLPQLVYAWFGIAQQIYAYYLFLCKHDQDW